MAIFKSCLPRCLMLYSLTSRVCLKKKKKKTAPAISSIIADLNLLLLLFEFEFYLCGRMQPSSVSFDTCSTLCMYLLRHNSMCCAGLFLSTASCFRQSCVHGLGRVLLWHKKPLITGNVFRWMIYSRLFVLDKYFFFIVKMIGLHFLEPLEPFCITSRKSVLPLPTFVAQS